MLLTAHWTPYVPDEKTPWDLRRVVHLHRRAGFASPWADLQRDLAEGPEKSIDRLLKGTAGPSTPEGFGATAELLAESAVSAGEIGRLKAWWFYRLLFGSDALGEMLTLLWHDHFATAQSKVADVALMRRQNDTFRKHARDKFTDLVTACVKEPAVLIYLDAPANRKGHANENLARELMELFTLGIGNYSEKDVKEAARALTGWTVEDGRFAVNVARHDTGEKSILGGKGAWTGDDLVKILLGHSTTADRIVFKLCRQFFGERGVPVEAKKSLAAGLRERGLEISWAVATILKSQAFFAAENIADRVLSPVEYVAGAVRAAQGCSTRPQARWRWRTGRRAWARTSSSRPTSAAGPAAGRGFTRGA